MNSTNNLNDFPTSKTIHYFLKNQNPESLIDSLDDTLQYIFYRYALIYSIIKAPQIEPFQARIITWFQNNAQVLKDYLISVRDNNNTSTLNTNKVNQINGAILILKYFLR